MASNKEAGKAKSLLVPFKAHLARMFDEEQVCKIYGNVPGDADMFRINLTSSKMKYIVFHFTPHIGEKIVIRNTLIDEKWGEQEYEEEHQPFVQGQDFVVEIRNEGEAYGVTVDGEKFCTYKHRLPFALVDSIEVLGEVNLNKVEYYSV